MNESRAEAERLVTDSRAQAERVAAEREAEADRRAQEREEAAAVAVGHTRTVVDQVSEAVAGLRERLDQVSEQLRSATAAIDGEEAGAGGGATPRPSERSKPRRARKPPR